MSVFDDPQFMAQSKRELRQFLASGIVPRSWINSLCADGGFEVDSKRRPITWRGPRYTQISSAE